MKQNAKSNPWAWRAIEETGTEAVRGRGSLTLEDTKVILVGTVAVSCSGETIGSMGPKNFGRVEKIENITCKPGEHCEKIEGNVKPLNLPWQTELVEEASGVRNKITAVNGKGAGWSVDCKVLGISKSDSCTTEEGSTKVENKLTKGVPGPLLVLATFDSNSANSKCEAGGAGSGVVRGTVAILQSNSQGLRYSLPS